MNKIRKEQKLVLIAIIALAIFFVASFITIALLPMVSDLKITILLILVVIVTVLSLVLKRQFDIKTYTFRRYALFENLEPAVSTKKKLMTPSWIESLEKLGYQNFKELGAFTIYYLVKEGLRKGSKYQTLFIVVIIKDPHVTFENQSLVRHINLLEDHLKNKTHYRQRIIYQFKEDKNFSQEKAAETNLVMFVNQRAYNLVVINAYYFSLDQVVYFVHSQEYPPTAYYSYATDELIKLIK